MKDIVEKTPVVCVLLSTYNGEKYLRAQIDSIFSQEGVGVQLVVRDDGSKDTTNEILHDYAKKHSNITHIQAQNRGVEESFYDLLKYSFTVSGCDYYAFCDQDDIWYNDKLYHSIQEIKKEYSPTLYCANQLITDSDLNPSTLMVAPEEKCDLLKWMQINYFSNRHGCTMVWNQKLEEVLSGIDKIIDYTPVHDVWLNVVARCSGKVIIGEIPLQYYRIHGLNASGLETNRIKRIRKGIKIYWLKDNIKSKYAKSCVDYFPKETQKGEGWDYLKVVAEYRDSFAKKMRLIRTRQIWYPNVAEGIFKAISVLIEKY